MNTGLFFGSFNPIHHGHLIIARHLINEGLVDTVWFIVSPQNPLKKSRSLLHENQRLHLVSLAIDEEEKMKASAVEFHLPKPSYTAVTLAHLSEKYPEKEFTIIMGSDSFQNLPNWKNHHYIIKNYNILVYNRPDFIISDDLGAKLKIVAAPLLEISATHVRNTIREGKSVRYLLPENVIEEIEKGGYYRK